jgi:hypothetical protein
VTPNQGFDSVLATTETRPGVLLQASVLGHAVRRVSREEIALLRRQPPATPAGWEPISPAALRYSDEQTVAGVAALVAALGAVGQYSPSEIDRWGVLSATRFLGRSTMVITLNRFRSEGVWGVSPHLIPHHSLHSPAGTFSLVLGIHGPNLGIGGGLFAGFEGILAGLSWLNSRIVPGVWLVFTRWFPDLAPDMEGNPLAPGVCQALALALVPVSDCALGRPLLQLQPASATGLPHPLDISQLAELLELDQTDGSPAAVSPVVRRHRGHDAQSGRPLPRAHFGFRTRRQGHARIITTDARGGMQITLASAGTAQVKEQA